MGEPRFSCFPFPGLKGSVQIHRSVLRRTPAEDEIWLGSLGSVAKIHVGRREV